LRTHLYNRAGMMGQGAANNAIEGTLRQTRRTLTPGTNLSGIIFYSMATSNIAVTNNPFAIPSPVTTPARPFAEFASGLTTGRSVNGATLYEPAGLTPIFSEPATIPTFSWKTAPTKGHLKGFARRADATPLDTASVTMSSLDGGDTRSGKTDGNGFYGGVDLASGSYLVKAVLGQDTLYSCVANVSPGIVTTADLAPETTAPQTTATVSPAAPNGENGWYTTDVTMSLSATDDCSGVAKTEYSIDNGETWIPYSGELSFTNEGVFMVQFRSVDRAGNVETAGSTTIKIDKTAPTLSTTADPTRIWPPNGKMVDVTISGSGTDAISGLASVSYAVTDEYGTPLSIAPRTLTGNSATWADVLAVEARRDGEDRDGRLYRITITVKDAAGHSTTSTVDVVVAHDNRK
jgi:hypothetical protein